MSIKFTCDQCGRELSAPDSAAGRKGKCKCGAVLEVPELTPVIPEAEVLDAEVMPAGEPDFDNLTYAVSQAASATPLPTSAPALPAEARRPCPQCGEMIAVSAVKCRFCSEIFDPALKRAAIKQVAGPDDDLTVAEWVVAILCSGIGCICGIVWMIQGKPKGKKMLAISLCVGAVWAIIQAIIGSSTRR